MATYSCSKPSEYKAQKKTKLKGSFNVERFNFFIVYHIDIKNNKKKNIFYFPSNGLTIKHLFYVRHTKKTQLSNEHTNKE